MKRKFFFGPASGLNADIERHRAKEADLRAKIAALELLDPSDPMRDTALRAYHNILQHLLDSKVEVVSRIGK